MDKDQVAAILAEIGTLLELQGENSFRCNAYHNGARAIAQLEEDLGEVVRQGWLTSIHGIGVDTVKEADYYRMSGSVMNTFSKEQAEQVVRETNGKVTIQEVVKMPLVVNINEVLDELFNGGAPDFLSIDVEGLDLPILRTLNFVKHRPKVICVETLIATSTKENPEINQILQSRDYVLRGSSLVNAIFVD